MRGHGSLSVGMVLSVWGRGGSVSREDTRMLQSVRGSGSVSVGDLVPSVHGIWFRQCRYGSVSVGEQAGSVSTGDLVPSVQGIWFRQCGPTRRCVDRPTVGVGRVGHRGEMSAQAN